MEDGPDPTGGDRVACIVCGQLIPLADLELYRHVMAHRAKGEGLRTWRRADDRQPT